MPLDESALRARRAYDSAADHFDDRALAFWARHGEQTVERLGLAPGAAVLDAACGSGASALPAARAVGPGGSVVGADLSTALVELARTKATRAGLTNVTFRIADMREVGYPDDPFDAVVCVFGIFFVDDMPALARELWRMVRPGGVLAVTTWGPEAFEPGATAFWDAVGQVRPDLVRSFNPWDKLTTPALRSWICSVRRASPAPLPRRRPATIPSWAPATGGRSSSERATAPRSTRSSPTSVPTWRTGCWRRWPTRRR